MLKIINNIFYKKLWHFIIIIIFCFGTYAYAQHAKNPLQADNYILIVGVSADYPPFEFKEGEEFKGLDIELARLIGHHLKKEIIFKDLSFNNLFLALEVGQIDFAISTITFTENRNKNFSLSDPYYFANIAIMFRKSHPIKNITEIETKKIGSQLGTTMEIWAKEKLPSAKLVAIDLNSQLIEALKSQQLDAIVVEDIQAKEFCKKNPDLGYLVADKANNGYVIMLKKHSPLLKDINLVLEKIKKDQEFIKLEKKWLEMVLETEVHDAS